MLGRASLLEPQYPDEEKSVTILACCCTWKPVLRTSCARTCRVTRRHRSRVVLGAGRRANAARGAGLVPRAEGLTRWEKE